MTRLQQNIEELKLESGDEGEDKKVPVTNIIIYSTHKYWIKTQYVSLDIAFFFFFKSIPRFVHHLG